MSAPQERRLYGQLLMALNAPYRPGDRLAAVEPQAQIEVVDQGIDNVVSGQMVTT